MAASTLQSADFPPQIAEVTSLNSTLFMRYEMINKILKKIFTVYGENHKLELNTRFFGNL